MRRTRGLRAEAQWSSLPQAVALFVRGRTARTAAPIALVVGTVLSAVNQGDVLLGGSAGVATWIRVGVNYAVPFCVASFGFLSARRVQAPGSAPVADGGPRHVDGRDDDVLP